jgi:hypothetical protein
LAEQANMAKYQQLVEWLTWHINSGKARVLTAKRAMEVWDKLEHDQAALSSDDEDSEDECPNPG